jgi:hypothetical protein
VTEDISNIIVNKIKEGECHNLCPSPCMFRVIKWKMKYVVHITRGVGGGIINLYKNGWNLKGEATMCDK